MLQCPMVSVEIQWASYMCIYLSKVLCCIDSTFSHGQTRNSVACNVGEPDHCGPPWATVSVCVMLGSAVGM